MQISHLGANCLKIKVNNVSIVIDDNLAQLRGKAVSGPDDVVCITNTKLIDQPAESRILFDMPGNYEVSNILINGIGAKSFMQDGEYMSAVMYKIIVDNLSLAVVGHIQADLSDEQLEQLGLVDILLIPVGGNGYTLDATGALQVTKNINPGIVIPTHYQQTGLKYEVAQASCDDFVNKLGIEPIYVKNPYKPKRADFSDQFSLVIFR